MPPAMPLGLPLVRTMTAYGTKLATAIYLDRSTVMYVATQWLPGARAPQAVAHDPLPSGTTRCAVLGIGNPLMADDGLGIHVVQALGKRAECFGAATGRVDLIDGGTLGYLLIDRLAGYDALIVIDAANLRAASGSVRVLCNDDLEAFLSDRSATSVHEVSLIDLLQMLRMSNEAPASLALVGVQPAVIDWSTDLSPEVAPSVDRACDEVRRLVNAWAKGDGLE